MDDSKRPDSHSTRRSNCRTRVTLSGIEPAAPQPGEVDPAEEEEGVTLEELSQSYQRMLAGADSGTATSPPGFLPETSPSDPALLLESVGTALGDSQLGDSQLGASPANGNLLAASLGDTDLQPDAGLDVEEDQDNAACPLTPQSIVEAILFVGRPDGVSIPAAEIAGLMRGVDASEVASCVAQLNEIYVQTNRATRIVADGAGYRIQLADDVKFVRDRFYGRVRHVKLNQAAIDCLALIAYQPGISREKLEQQRGQPSGSLLSQLIRRQLIDMRRVTEDKQAVQRYYPTNRLLDLTGIESLDDLPQTEDLE